MIKNNLNYYLNARKISINKLSKDTGISRKTLTQMANNDGSGFQFKTIETLINYFDIGLSDLIYNKDDNTTLAFYLLSYDSSDRVLAASKNSRMDNPFVVDVMLSNDHEKSVYHSFIEISDVSSPQKPKPFIQGFIFNLLDVSGLSREDVIFMGDAPVPNILDGFFNTTETKGRLFKTCKKIVERVGKFERTTDLTTDPLFPIGCALSFMTGSFVSLLDKNIRYSKYLFMSWIENPFKDEYTDFFANELYSVLYNGYKLDEDTNTDLGFTVFGEQLVDTKNYIPDSITFNLVDFQNSEVIDPRKGSLKF